MLFLTFAHLHLHTCIFFSHCASLCSLRPIFMLEHPSRLVRTLFPKARITPRVVTLSSLLHALLGIHSPSHILIPLFLPSQTLRSYPLFSRWILVVSIEFTPLFLRCHSSVVPKI